MRGSCPSLSGSVEKRELCFTGTSSCEAFFRSVALRMGSRAAQAAPKPL